MCLQRIGHLARVIYALCLLGFPMSGLVRAGQTIGDDRLPRSVVMRLAQLVDARLALEAWKSEQLESLQQRGYATWREVAEQKLVVETLEAHRSAIDSLARFIGELADRMPPESALQASGRVPPGTSLRSATRLDVTGPQRRVAWMPAGLTPTPIAPQRNQESDRTKTLRQEVAAAERRLDGLRAVGAKDKMRAEIRQQELRLAVARAELELEQVVEQPEQASNDGTIDLDWQARSDVASGKTAGDHSEHVGASAPLAGGGAAVFHDASPALLVASRRVAEAEARGTGAVRLADIMVQRERALVASLIVLRGQGLASVQEVAAAEEQLKGAEQHLDRSRQRSDRLMELCKMLQPAPDGLDQAVPSELDVSWIADGVLRDRALVRHLVELRARRCAASAAVAAAKARLALLEEQDRRLRARTANLGFKTASGEGDSPILFGGAHKIGTVPGGFETASQLDRGSKQPLFARLEIEQLRAELLASEEQLHATRLEEVRFAIQAAAQADANRRQPQYKTTVVNSRRRLTTADSEGDSPKRFSDCFLAGIAGCSTPQLAFYVAPYRPQSSTVTDEPRWLIGERAFATSMYWPRYPGMNRDGLDDRHLRGVETSYTIPVYADFYSFGTRRPDLSPVEGRATSFGGPWFFPGAPTNFR